MIQYQFFPRSRGLTDEMRQVVDCFNSVNDKISSETNDLVSNDVLAILRPLFEKIGFVVETGKTKDAKIDVPVLFGVDNKVDKSFYADALSQDGKIVVEVEAGQATENNHFRLRILRFDSRHILVPLLGCKFIHRGLAILS